MKVKPVKFFVLIALAVAAPGHATLPTWDLNDVSILSPLPKGQAELAAMIRATTPSDLARGKTENLIPSGIYDELIASFKPSERDALRPLYAKWTAISFRIDPCFREHFTDACRKEIRVVWQPVSFVAGRAIAEDSALHTFYPISDEEWPRALKDFASFKSVPTAGLPLGVHPGFTKDGLTGAFARNFHRKMKSWIAQSRLATLAVTLPSDGGTKRLFKRFVVFETTAVLRLFPLWISYSAELEIRYGNASVRRNTAYEFTEAAPATLQTLSSQDDLRELLRNSRAARKDRAGLVRFAEIQRRALDPSKHASLTIDCLSCHAADAAGKWLAANLTAVEKSKISEPSYLNPGAFDLTNTSAVPRSTVRMRAFGYHGSEVHLLDRVIHESANVAAAFNRDFPLSDFLPKK